MNLCRPFLWLAPIIVLGVLGFTIVRPPLIEPGLQVAKSGVVLDAQTRQPLVGAYVVVRWLEQSPRPTTNFAALRLERSQRARQHFVALAGCFSPSRRQSSELPLQSSH